MGNGRKKQVICLDVRDSAVYERAFLILRSGAGEDDEELLLREADRLVSRAMERRTSRGRGRRTGRRGARREDGARRERSFLSGLCVGGAGASLLLGAAGLLRFFLLRG